ncbi:MAG: proteasome endopeptidase complex, archaeal, beta subunit [Thermoplasmata archaeon]|nr:MAG: archaeal proteasome endopeptidase complex subunit beta [Thermoplasmata archaeon]RLF48027.1 MAG: proteasome endopeptidase complex, archaeal, beta subunit [Thermoplasmata archaeon]HDN95938.1 archaeal proteasome endopeptidase complex subunit beta [Thermoplasmatales archaeon]
MEMETKKGTTTLGLVFKDGIVAAAEHRATMGTLIAHKVAKKIFKIDDHMLLTTAGLVGDAQLLARFLRVEAELYKLEREEKMPVKGAATLMANILNQRKFYPYYVQLIIGGVDSTGPHIFSLDPAGGAIEDIYTTTGSGSPYVFGVLEDNYKENMELDEAINLAIRAMAAAMKRDAASGDGMDVVVITKKEYRELSREEIEERKKKLGL